MIAQRAEKPAAEVFLRLTDYVKGQDLCNLSVDALQVIVCGGDGKKLERIQLLNRVDSVQFVSAPFPGFRIEGNCETFVQLAVIQVEDIMREIRQACSKPQTKKTPSRNNFYHPLFSANQYHLIAPSRSPGLLPIPTIPTEDEFQSPPERQLSDEEYRQLVRSPYLCAYKRKVGMMKNSVPSEAVTEAGDSSPELLTREASEADIMTSQQVYSEFDQFELKGCLPGVPGVRQSKDYKRIRRKISEIDELLKRPFEALDHCQRMKISKRSEYVEQVRHMLLHGVDEEKTREEENLSTKDFLRHTNEQQSFSEEEKHTAEPQDESLISHENEQQPRLLALRPSLPKKPTQQKKKSRNPQSSPPITAIPPPDIVEVKKCNDSVSVFLYAWIMGLINDWLLPFVLCWVAFFIGEEHQSSTPSRLGGLRSGR
jgi:hypothetical protein